MTSPRTPLEAITRRAEQAARGPWHLDTEWCDCGDDRLCGHGEYPYSLTLPEPHTMPADSRPLVEYHFQYSEISHFTLPTADFIAHARDDVPALTAAVRAVLALADQWESSLMLADAASALRTAVTAALAPACPDCHGTGEVAVGRCTCGTGPSDYPPIGTHRQGCGAEPCPNGCPYNPAARRPVKDGHDA